MRTLTITEVPPNALVSVPDWVAKNLHLLHPDHRWKVAALWASFSEPEATPSPFCECPDAGPFGLAMSSGPNGYTKIRCTMCNKPVKAVSKPEPLAPLSKYKTVPEIQRYVEWWEKKTGLSWQISAPHIPGCDESKCQCMSCSYEREVVKETVERMRKRERDRARSEEQANPSTVTDAAVDAAAKAAIERLTAPLADKGPPHVEPRPDELRSLDARIAALESRMDARDRLAEEPPPQPSHVHTVATPTVTEPIPKSSAQIAVGMAELDMWFMDPLNTHAMTEPKNKRDWEDKHAQITQARIDYREAKHREKGNGK